jgi:hypothetical protein
MSTSISIVNKSTLVQDIELLPIIVGMNTLLHTLVQDWNLPPLHCIMDIGKPKNGLAVYVVDTPDVRVPTNESRPYGIVYIKPIFDNGGSLYTGAASVSQYLSHEVFEMAGDLSASKWWKIYGNTYIAGEICDPVQGECVQLTVGNTLISFSDWVLPSWIDLKNETGPFDHLNVLKSPYIMDHAGYMVTLVDGNIVYKFGHKVPAWVETIKRQESRISKRLPSN